MKSIEMIHNIPKADVKGISDDFEEKGYNVVLLEQMDGTYTIMATQKSI
jgi:hypothetical protein